MSQFLTYSYSSVAQQVVCAEDAISNLPGILDRLGSTRAMVVCGPSILEKSNVIQRVQDALGDRCVGLFSGVAPHSAVHTLDEVMRLAKDSKPDALVVSEAAAPTTPPRESPPSWTRAGRSTIIR